MNENRPSINNVFFNGLHSDNSFEFQPPNTYREATNIRVLFNEGGSLSIENDKGNLLSFTLKDYAGNTLTDYVPIGSANFSDKVVIFSTNGTNSEIGYVTFDADGIGTYKQIFNDAYDPNGDLLGFNVLNSIEARPVKENDGTENVYWTDNNKEISVINIQRGDSFSWSPTLGVYPYWYSVHSLRLYCDFSMGRIKFKERIEGKLKTGVYQYSYRMGTYDGYRTPWYPITRHFIMNSQEYAISGVLGDNPYQMQPSNDVTVYGNRIQITGIDERFPIIEVAYIYSISETQTVDAGVFYYRERGAKGVGTLTVDHTTHAGDPIALDEFNIKYFPIRKGKTLVEKDNYLFIGNVTEVGVLEPDVSGATINPITRLMEADYRASDEDMLPYMDSQIVDTTVNITSYTGTTESYDIKNEFANYRGTAFENLFTSYWRGETYRIGVLLYDRKGMPNYTFHIDDFTFPEQYDTSGNFTLTEVSGGVWKIKIMGFEVNNLVIPQDVLYDDDGELKISGFAIVRAKRVPQTQFQGIVMPTVYENNVTTDASGTERWKYTRPLPMTENYFLGNVTPVTDSYANNSLLLIGARARSNSEFGQRTGTVLMHSPEILFGYTPTPEWTVNTNIKSVGVAATSGQEENQPGYNRIFSETDPKCHFYSKNYDTVTTSPSGFDFGEVSYIEEGGIFSTGLGNDYKIEDYDTQEPDLIYTQFGVVDFASSGSDCACEVDKFSWGQPDSLLLLLKDLKDVSAGTDAERNKVLIANFRKPADSYFAGADENALEKTIYISTGHFQPINADVVADTENADGDLVFNNVEVWGGDCYPFFFDFTRLLPQYRDCDESDGCFHDYSVSMIAPLESNINFSLRIGRQFGYNSIEPEDTACGDTPFLAHGIQEKQREDFNINSVLMHEENVQFFSAKPTDIVNRTENPMTIIHSNLKYYGEPIDNYRRYLVNNFIDLTGVNGDITKLFAQYSYVYYLQQRGFGRLYINQPATLSSPEQGSILVGSAGVLTGALYLSQEIGCQHQFSVVTGHNQTYWVDVNLGKMYRFDQNGVQPLSDQKGQHNRIFTACKYYKDKDRPASRGGIHGIYDYKNNEFVCTFRMGIKTGLPDDSSLYEFTLVYSENTQAYTTLFSETPKFYCNFGGLYFLDDDTAPQNIYVALKGDRGNYFGVVKESEFQIVVNADLNIQKIFDTNVINVNADGATVLSQAAFSTDINSVTLSLLTDPRVKYRHGLEYFPVRGISQSDRIRGKYLSSTYTINNLDNKLCRITTITTKIRPVFPR